MEKIFTNMSLYAVFFLRHTRSYIGSFPNIHFMLKYIGKLCCMSVCVCGVGIDISMHRLYHCRSWWWIFSDEFPVINLTNHPKMPSILAMWVSSRNVFSTKDLQMTPKNDQAVG